MNARTIQITLTLERDGETIAGRAVGSDGRERQFSGWIGLMGVLDALLDSERPADAADRPGESSTQEETRC